jgi:hypothetical protein
LIYILRKIHYYNVNSFSQHINHNNFIAIKQNKQYIHKIAVMIDKID